MNYILFIMDLVLDPLLNSLVINTSTIIVIKLFNNIIFMEDRTELYILNIFMKFN